MATTTYEQDAATTGPAWLRARVGAAWRGAVGALLDWYLDVAKQAVKARHVQTSPEDGLAEIGRERSIERYPADTLATYRARLLLAWDLWQQGGTAAGIIAALNAAGFGSVAIYTALGAAPPGEAVWPPDGNTANWSRFWVHIDATAVGGNPFNWAAVTWGSLNWGAGWTWGSTATAEQIALVRRVVRLWKAAHEVCAGLLIDLPGGHRIRVPGME